MFNPKQLKTIQKQKQKCLKLKILDF